MSEARLGQSAAAATAALAAAAGRAPRARRRRRRRRRRPRFSPTRPRAKQRPRPPSNHMSVYKASSLGCHGDENCNYMQMQGGKRRFRNSFISWVRRSPPAVSSRGKRENQEKRKSLAHIRAHMLPWMARSRSAHRTMAAYVAATCSSSSLAPAGAPSAATVRSSSCLACECVFFWGDRRRRRRRPGEKANNEQKKKGSCVFVESGTGRGGGV